MVLALVLLAGFMLMRVWRNDISFETGFIEYFLEDPFEYSTKELEIVIMVIAKPSCHVFKVCG